VIPAKPLVYLICFHVLIVHLISLEALINEAADAFGLLLSRELVTISKTLCTPSPVLAEVKIIGDEARAGK